MAEADVHYLPEWDVTRSDTLAFLRGLPQLVDFAASCGIESSADGNGVAFEVLPPGDFLAWFGTAAVPLQPVGPPAGNAVQLTIWRAADAALKDQAKWKIFVRNKFLTWLPDRLLVPMRDQNRSIRTRTTVAIVSTLQEQLGTLTKEDVHFLMKQLKEPHRVGTSVPSFLADWQAVLLDLERAQQPLPQIMATDILMECFGPEFVTCWLSFVKDVPIVANRTVVRLCAAVTLFAANALPMICAQTAIGISLVTNQTAMLAQLQDQIVALQQALAVSQAQPTTRKRGGAPPAGPPARVARQQRDTVPIAQRLFCWTHGPCHTHKGDGCENKLVGHKDTATWQNQMGSTWKDRYTRRGWPIV